MKRTFAALATAPVLLAGLAIVSAPAAHADDRVCRGSIGAVTVDGNIIVPSGATCTLTRTVVKGNIHTYADSHLLANGVRVNGNIQADNHARVVVGPDGAQRATVGGSIQLKSGRASTLQSSLTNVVVKGDIQSFSNRHPLSITRNNVDGNLQCKSSNPAPTGSLNIVKGNKEDQCKGF
jgi:hypothetical protein